VVHKVKQVNTESKERKPERMTEQRRFSVVLCVFSAFSVNKFVGCALCSKKGTTRLIQEQRGEQPRLAA
jgi:hypothetical protein